MLCSETKPAEAGTKWSSGLGREDMLQPPARGSVQRPRDEVACEQRPGGSESCRNPGQRPWARTCWCAPGTGEHSEAGTEKTRPREGWGRSCRAWKAVIRPLADLGALEALPSS